MKKILLSTVAIVALGVAQTQSQQEPFSVYVRNLPAATSITTATDLLPVLQSGGIERSASPALINSATVQLNQCVIDNVTYAGTMAGIQAALNNASCKDIYVPAGTFTGNALLQINRSNVKLHGAGGATTAQNIASGQVASTILSSSCFNPGANPVILIGDGSATLTYGGIEISDMALQLPATCNMIGVQINTSTPDVPQALRRMRITQGAGTASGTGVFLGNNVYNWTFDDVVVDRFAQSYRLSGANNLVKFSRGMMANGSIGINHQNSVANESGPIVVEAVDFENFTTAAIDLGAIESAEITNNYFGQGIGGAGALSIRLGAVAAQQPRGVTIAHNLFNAGGISNYAIELNANAGFFGASIHDNYFLGFLTAAVHNLTTTNGSFGYYGANTLESTAADLTAASGFLTVQGINGPQQLGAPSGQPTNFTDGNNGNDFIVAGAGATIANQLTARAATTGNGPSLAATGTDTNILLALASKGTGFVGAWGTGPTWPGMQLGVQSGNLGNGALTFYGNTSGGFTISVPATGGTPQMSTPWPVAAGGTGDTGTAWSTFTPSPSCGTATFSGTVGRFKQIGKTVFIKMSTQFAPTVGTCLNTTPFTFTLPATSQGTFSITGVEISNSGNFVVCAFGGGGTTNTAQCYKNGTFGGGTNWNGSDIPFIEGVYEAN